VYWAANLDAAAFGAAVSAVTGALVPRIIERIPEPEPEPEEAEAAEEPRFEGESTKAPEPPKETYYAMADLGWLLPVSAVLGAVSGLLLGWTLGWSWLLLVLLPFVPVGIALSVIDFRTRLLPTWLIVRAMAGVAVLGLVVMALTQDWTRGSRALLGAVIAFVLYFVLWWVSPKMGYGDVRLAGLLGLVLAFVGWQEFLVGMYGSFLLFAVPGVLVALVRWDRAFLKTLYPFGPSMIAGALIGICFGEPIMNGLVGT
jgi:leader peptidase (prepilin peptidase)/N-methyltransferase